MAEGQICYSREIGLCPPCTEATPSAEGGYPLWAVGGGGRRQGGWRPSPPGGWPSNDDLSPFSFIFYHLGMKFTDTAGERSCWIATTKMIAPFLSRRDLNIWLFYNARQASWGNILKHTVEKNLINATNVTYASSWVMNLRTHLKMHSGEKSYKCKQCDFPSYQADDLRTHLKIHNDTQWRKNLTNVTNVTRLAIKQAI